jgi:hypothetical protein
MISPQELDEFGLPTIRFAPFTQWIVLIRSVGNLTGSKG